MSTVLPDHLVETIERLGYSDDSGLVTADTRQDLGTRDYVWRELRRKTHLDAAFFIDGVPVVGFSGAGGDASNLRELRRRLWNYGRLPLLVVSGPEDIVAYNAVANPNGSAHDGAVLARQRRSDRAKDLLSAFARLEIEAGRFAGRYEESYRRAGRVDGALLANLGYLRRSSISNEPGSRTSVDSLIGGALLASYLVDGGILGESHLIDLAGQRNLQDVLTSGVRTTRRLFEGLAEHFNGDVFGFLPEALTSINDNFLQEVASLLRGDDLVSRQMALWPYDFSVVPPDLVSGIYEQLLEDTRRTDAAYYTPRFLVDLVLDEVLPLHGELQPTIIDMACGSGAFVTEAFRRLAYRERNLHGDDQIYERLRRLLLENVYAIDSNPTAARVAVFGLYLALLEELEPPTVWATARLPQLLGQTVVVSDAFADHSLSSKRFDAVIGNPPWASKLTPRAKKFVKAHRLPVSDQQIAQAFLWLAKDMLAPKGTMGLVMPAKGLLHNRSKNAKAFRTDVFRDLRVRTIVDLSAVRRNVFATAIAPAAIIVADNPDPAIDVSDATTSDKEIVHLAAHPRSLSKVTGMLVIAPEEVRSVSSSLAQARPDIWKVLLWGNRRDLKLLDKLRLRFPPVEDLAKERGWTISQGYQIGGGDENDASDLIGMPVIEAQSVLPLTLAPGTRRRFTQPILHRTRDRAIYLAPHALVRRTMHAGRLAAAMLDEDAVFPSGVVGIGVPEQDRALLGMFVAATVSSVGRYWHFMTSASWGVERDFVEENEYISLPLPTPGADDWRRLEGIFSRAGRKVDARLLEELDDLVFDIYKLSSSDRVRINERLVHDLERFNKARSYMDEVDDRELSEYRNIVCSVLGRTLPRLNLSGKLYREGSYRCVAVAFADPTLNETSDNGAGGLRVDIDRILQSYEDRPPQTRAILAQPAGLFVDEDTVYVVKTADRDRWSLDAALDDADRILGELAFGLQDD